MRQILSTLCLAIAATACCGAHAQGAPSAAAATPAQRAERFNERMAHLKQRLKITPAQEGAWDAFVQAMQPQPHPEQRADAGGQKLTTPQRLDRVEARRQEMDAAAQRHDQAIRTLYVQLNPEQQKIFDGVIARMQQHGHHPGGASRGQGETPAN
jgi:hypothetical protein